jgi:hypothetical protein
MEERSELFHDQLIVPASTSCLRAFPKIGLLFITAAGLNCQMSKWYVSSVKVTHVKCQDVESPGKNRWFPEKVEWRHRLEYNQKLILSHLACHTRHLTGQKVKWQKRKSWNPIYLELQNSPVFIRKSHFISENTKWMLWNSHGREYCCKSRWKRWVSNNCIDQFKHFITHHKSLTSCRYIYIELWFFFQFPS